MTIHEQLVNGIEAKEFSVKGAVQREVPDAMPNLHFIGLLAGSRGSGKTNAMLRLVELYDSAKSFDKVILVSPTFQNDPKYRELEKGSYRFEVYEEYSEALMLDIIASIKKDIDDYKDGLEYQKAYDLLKKWKKPLGMFPLEMLLTLEKHDYAPPHEVLEWDHMPTTLLLFDDLMYSSLYTNTRSVSNNFAIKHRHHATSILFLTQSWKGGVPRALRANLSLIILFSTRDKTVIEDIAKEVSAYVSPEKFEQLFLHATEERFQFLMINNDTSDPSKRFRKNFNCFLTVE
jgi:hypothetical protein